MTKNVIEVLCFVIVVSVVPTHVFLMHVNICWFSETSGRGIITTASDLGVLQHLYRDQMLILWGCFLSVLLKSWRKAILDPQSYQTPFVMHLRLTLKASAILQISCISQHRSRNTTQWLCLQTQPRRLWSILTPGLVWTLGLVWVLVCQGPVRRLRWAVEIPAAPLQGSGRMQTALCRAPSDCGSGSVRRRGSSAALDQTASSCECRPAIETQTDMLR